MYIVHCTHSSFIQETMGGVHLIIVQEQALNEHKHIYCIFIPCMRACLPHTVILGPYTSPGKTNNIHEATSCQQRRNIS